MDRPSVSDTSVLPKKRASRTLRLVIRTGIIQDLRIVQSTDLGVTIQSEDGSELFLPSSEG